MFVQGTEIIIVEVTVFFDRQLCSTSLIFCKSAVNSALSGIMNCLFCVLLMCLCWLVDLTG